MNKIAVIEDVERKIYQIRGRELEDIYPQGAHLFSIIQSILAGYAYSPALEQSGAGLDRYRDDHIDLRISCRFS